VNSKISKEIQNFIKEGFTPHFNELKDNFQSNPAWQKLRQVGTELWLDTGNIEDSEEYWTQQFSALTTNNTLLNKEVQTGIYDSLILQANKLLSNYPQFNEQQRMLEIAFILNSKHGLKLVEKFDAFVSVEEHTDLANTVQEAVECARRYHSICPERFIIKIPFTPAGILTTRKLSNEGIPVNHTLGFSARQNYIVARIAKPAFVNVFLGRLNSFIADNNLGDGSYVGEKTTLASQSAITKLREQNLTTTRQIGASLREGAQVRDLAGIDVMTMPPKVAGQFLSLNLPPEQITDKTTQDYTPGLNQDIEPDTVNLRTLWDIDDCLIKCIDNLEKENIDNFTPDDLVEFFEEHNCADAMVPWTQSQIQTSKAEGKIPNLENFKDALADNSIGLDSLMNLAGLNSFTTDQQAMDQRVKNVLTGKK